LAAGAGWNVLRAAPARTIRWPPALQTLGEDVLLVLTPTLPLRTDEDKVSDSHYSSAAINVNLQQHYFILSATLPGRRRFARHPV